MLAIIKAFTVQRIYLKGSPHKISVIIDYKNLVYFTTSKVLNRRQARWSKFLGSFNFTISYRLGVNNTKADILSRRTDYLLEGHSTNKLPKPPLIKPDQLIITVTETLASLPNVELLLYYI